ncbi:membrane-targeted effector domain-containing toxin [Pseudomonas sp. SDO528_S397]
MISYSNARLLSTAPPALLHVVKPAVLQPSTDTTPAAPALGSLNGALGWPVPLNPEQQRAIEDLVDNNTANLPGLPLISRRQGALGYLLQGQRLPPQVLRDPAAALEQLLRTPRAQALGEALQTKLAGFPTATSKTDYLLAALHIGLDPESIDTPQRNSVAGFNLASAAHWGKPASAVINALGRHLESERRTDAGELAARLLLARVAPVFLVKDIPDHVVYGSHAWATLCIAVARQEAQVQGSAHRMTYAQLMDTTHTLTQAPPAPLLREALIDWGVCNGYLPRKNDEHYTPQALDLTRATFNQQLHTLKSAAERLQTPLPSRKALALAALKQQFAGIEDSVFEARTLSIKDTEFNPGSRSMLDILMEGSNTHSWETRDARIPIAAFNAFNKSIDIPGTFEPELAEHKEVHATLVKQLIARLPVEDRERFAYGQLEFFKESTYAPGVLSDTLESRKNSLLIKIEHNQTRYVYELDPEHGLVRNTPRLPGSVPGSRRIGNTLYKIERFIPRSDTEQRPIAHSHLLPQSFSSERTQYLADVYLEALGLDAQARGMTSFDQERGQQDMLKNFLLDLIPLRSAIHHFKDGQIGAGIADLAVDIFGFVTAGVGASAKAIKVIGTTGSVAHKLLKGVKILGAAAIGELNPASGVLGVLEGSAKAISHGSERFKALFRAADGQDLLTASSLHGICASGELRVGNDSLHTTAVLHDDQWYHYNRATQQPYGPPLDDFTPSTWADAGTLMPPDRHSLGTGTHRYNPVAVNSHPPFAPTRVPVLPRKTDHLLPGDYLVNTQAKEVHAHFTPSRLEATRERFREDMRAYYSKPVTRPALPALNVPATANTLMSQALDHTDVLVVGESHRGMSSFQTLYDAMDTYKAKGVKSLFCEGLLQDGKGGWRDAGLGTLGANARTPGKFPALADLLEKARANGIQVIPLEHYWLTRRKDTPGLYHNIQPDTPLSRQRLEEFNYFAARTIEQHANGGKSVVLVGRSHLMTCEGVPGITELTNGIGISIYEGQQNIAMRSTHPLPDPEKSLKTGEMAGDFQIFRKVT